MPQLALIRFNANLFTECFHSIFNNSPTVLSQPEELLTLSSVLNEVRINESDVYNELIVLKYD